MKTDGGDKQMRSRYWKFFGDTWSNQKSISLQVSLKMPKYTYLIRFSGEELNGGYLESQGNISAIENQQLGI